MMIDPIPVRPCRWQHRHVLRVGFAITALLFAHGRTASAQNVTISLPATETFTITNVLNAVTGSPQTTITWSSGNFSGGNHFRLSVKADAANFTAPAAGRTAIAANLISWTIASATNGTGSAGTLSSSAYVAVYNASNGKKNGTVTINWNMSAVGVNHRAGSHLLTMRWRLEAAP